MIVLPGSMQAAMQCIQDLAARASTRNEALVMFEFAEQQYAGDPEVRCHDACYRIADPITLLVPYNQVLLITAEHCRNLFAMAHEGSDASYYQEAAIAKAQKVR